MVHTDGVAFGSEICTEEVKALKLIIILILLLLTSGTSNGAVSGDMSEYVRRDVFDAKMEGFMKEIRGEFQVMNAKIEALSRRIDDNYHSLEARINGLDTRINDVQNYIYLVLVLLGIIVGLPTVQKVYQSVKASRPSITLEDVKRLIEENNAELLKTLRS